MKKAKLKNSTGKRKHRFSKQGRENIRQAAIARWAKYRAERTPYEPLPRKGKKGRKQSAKTRAKISAPMEALDAEKNGKVNQRGLVLRNFTRPTERVGRQIQAADSSALCTGMEDITIDAIEIPSHKKEIQKELLIVKSGNAFARKRAALLEYNTHLWAAAVSWTVKQIFMEA